MGFLHVGHHGGIGQPRPGYKSDHLRRFWGVKVAGGSPPLTKADVEEQETPPENHHDVQVHLILKNGDHWIAFHVYLFEQGTKNSKLWIFLEILPFQPYPKHHYFTTFSKPLTITPVSNEISPVPTSTNTRPKLQREEVVVPDMPYLSRGFGRSQFLRSLS